jgi:hypothetical protein
MIDISLKPDQKIALEARHIGDYAKHLKLIKPVGGGYAPHLNTE